MAIKSIFLLKSFITIIATNSNFIINLLLIIYYLNLSITITLSIITNLNLLKQSHSTDSIDLINSIVLIYFVTHSFQNLVNYTSLS
jgi:hypothetical protein